jgi:hypothetical protein
MIAKQLVMEQLWLEEMVVAQAELETVVEQVVEEVELNMEVELETEIEQGIRWSRWSW